MLHRVRIALDAMGGDHGPAIVLAGAELSLLRHPGMEFVLYGDRAAVAPLLTAHPRLQGARLVHTDVSVKMDEKPSQALRNGRWKSSMWLAIDAVKKGEADAVISAGNTGALMAMAKFHLKTMAGVERPAIAARWPTLTGAAVVLDLGATIGADAPHLVNLAVMGSAMAHILGSIARPKVGLLNIGVEEVKGLEPVREAGRILRETARPQLDYVGFVEGNDIGTGKVDVVVTEGFTGNIALKTAEGTAQQIAAHLKSAMGSSLRNRVGYLLARGAFNLLRQKMDPRKFNGGVFLGLNGVVIKSHGSTDAEGYSAAIDVGYEMVHQDLLSQIRHALGREMPMMPPAAAQAAGGAAS
jgi:glycerol-3-phosphate acyltransferase PlsX